MPKSLTLLFRGALARATPSVRAVAAQMDVARSTLDLYANRVAPSTPMARRLVGWLRAQAQTLAADADRLEAALGDTPRGARPTRRAAR